MKIAIYRPSKDEQREFEKQASLSQLEFEIIEEPLTLGTAHFAKGAAGISIPGGEGNINQPILDAIAAQGVKVIATRSIGYNHIDVDYAKSIGLKICISDYAPNAVSEHTLMLILMTLRHAKITLERVKEQNYQTSDIKGRELKDLTVGVVGTGNIGESVIYNLIGFGCTILATDKTVKTNLTQFATYVSLEELFAKSDIITLHLPLNSKTHHFIGKNEIARMKDGVILINCSRGELMDTDALIEGIESKKIAALGLDVLESEDVFFKQLEEDITKKNNALVEYPNVIITPHNAYHTDVAISSIVKSSLDGLKALIKGESWKNEIN